MKLTRRIKETKDCIDNEDSSASYLKSQHSDKKSLKVMLCGKITTDALLVLILLVLISFRVNFNSNQNLNQNGNQNIQVKETVLPVPAPKGYNQESSYKIPDFLSIGLKYGTDKVAGNIHLEKCVKDPNECRRLIPQKSFSKRHKCRPWGHFYNTFYQRRLGHLSFPIINNKKEYQFLEIGFFNGKGYDTFSEFFPSAEMHSMEISCMDGSPFSNSANGNINYKSLLEQDRLHCGDANNVNWLHKIWTEKMNRTDAPPLNVVVDDGSHLAEHMAQTVFFWFPRIQPRGILVVEDIQPMLGPNKFRTEFLPQIMSDLHYCGDPTFPDDGPCYPTLMPLLASITCEMHICMFERNDEPAIELDLESSTMPASALDASKCPSLNLLT